MPSLLDQTAYPRIAVTGAELQRMVGHEEVEGANKGGCKACLLARLCGREAKSKQILSSPHKWMMCCLVNEMGKDDGYIKTEL